MFHKTVVPLWAWEIILLCGYTRDDVCGAVVVYYSSKRRGTMTRPIAHSCKRNGSPFKQKCCGCDRVDSTRISSNGHSTRIYRSSSHTATQQQQNYNSNGPRVWLVDPSPHIISKSPEKNTQYEYRYSYSLWILLQVSIYISRAYIIRSLNSIVESSHTCSLFRIMIQGTTEEREKGLGLTQPCTYTFYGV